MFYINKRHMLFAGAFGNCPDDAPSIRKGCHVNGEIYKVLGDKVMVRCPLRSKGSVCISDASDDDVQFPLQSYFVGQFVR